jgi:hypothetical protein
MTKTRKLLIVATTVVRLASFGTLSPVLAMTVPGLHEDAGASRSEPAIVLAQSVVRRPVYDSAGQTVNRLPGRSLGLGKPTKMRCGNYDGINKCRPV